MTEHDEWRDMSDAPNDGSEFLAAVPVYGSEFHPTKPRGFLYWEFDIISLNPETGEIPLNRYCGWQFDDYVAWRPLPAPPEKAE